MSGWLGEAKSSLEYDYIGRAQQAAWNAHAWLSFRRCGSFEALHAA